MTEDPVITHLNLIARLLEAAGYAIDVDYGAAVIVVWLDQWPAVVGIKKTAPTNKPKKEE